MICIYFNGIWSLSIICHKMSSPPLIEKLQALSILIIAPIEIHNVLRTKTAFMSTIYVHENYTKNIAQTMHHYLFFKSQKIFEKYSIIQKDTVHTIHSSTIARSCNCTGLLQHITTALILLRILPGNTGKFSYRFSIQDTNYYITLFRFILPHFRLIRPIWHDTWQLT
jgi:hypothetical protein